MKVRLSRAQAEQLLSYCKDAYEAGCYYGNREQFWKRHEQIQGALYAALRSERDAASNESSSKEE